MKNHEKAFSDIKNYYNDITLNNLALKVNLSTLQTSCSRLTAYTVACYRCVYSHACLSEIHWRSALFKEQVEDMKKKEERMEKQMNEIMAENKRLTEPLQKAREQVEELRKQVKKNYIERAR